MVAVLRAAGDNEIEFSMIQEVANQSRNGLKSGHLNRGTLGRHKSSVSLSEHDLHVACIPRCVREGKVKFAITVKVRNDDS